MGTAHGLAMIKCVRQGEDEWVMEWDWSAPDARATYLGHLRDFFADFGLQLVDQNVDEDFIHEMKVEIHTMTQTAVTAFTLLNTKNIEAETVTPDAALQRARARRGRLPLVTYKVLKVRLPKPQRVRQRRGRPGRAPLAGGAPETLHGGRAALRPLRRHVVLVTLPHRPRGADRQQDVRDPVPRLGIALDTAPAPSQTIQHE